MNDDIPEEYVLTGEELIRFNTVYNETRAGQLGLATKKDNNYWNCIWYRSGHPLNTESTSVAHHPSVLEPEGREYVVLRRGHFLPAMESLVTKSVRIYWGG